MAEVLTFGEAMLRLSPPGNHRIEQATGFEVVVGGSEQNVAVALAGLGRQVAFVTRLPDNPLGRLIYNRTRERGVDVRHVLWGGDRAGLYFYEQAAAPRSSQVVYDRAGSAASTLAEGDINWPALLAGGRLLHTSGITAALSTTCLSAVEEALRTARQLGVATSFDLNYRSRLWSESAAAIVYRRLAPHCRILFASASALSAFFGLHGTPEQAAQACRAEFGCALVVLTDRPHDSGRTGSIRALAVGETTADSGELSFEVVDRLGAGDAFVAGFLDAYLDGDIQRAVHQGVAMAAWKHTVPGEFCIIDRAELHMAMAQPNRAVVR